jgi:hypothetical protein
MTLDLTELDGITEDGCQALRDFGAAVALQRRKFRTLDDPQIEFSEGGTA